MKFQITNFSGYFYVTCINTGKLLIQTTFKSYNDAYNAAKNL